MPRLLAPSWRDLREGALQAGLPQLPLTALNSVVAVSALADSLYPQRCGPPAPRSALPCALLAVPCLALQCRLLHGDGLCGCAHGLVCVRPPM